MFNKIHYLPSCLPLISSPNTRHISKKVFEVQKSLEFKKLPPVIFLIHQRRLGKLVSW